jgi:hypothetical protein
VCVRDGAEIRAETFMPIRVIVDIDLAAVAANLSREEQRQVDEQEVRQWLRDAGFRPHGHRWIVTEADLGQLDPSEVISLDDAPNDDRDDDADDDSDADD